MKKIKNRDNILLQNQNKRSIQIRDLVLSYVELENKLNASEEKMNKKSHKSIKTFANEIFSKGPKRNCITNKTDVYHIDDNWSLNILDLKDYGSENNRGYRYALVIIDNFSKFCWTVPLKKMLQQ